MIIMHVMCKNWFVKKISRRFIARKHFWLKTLWHNFYLFPFALPPNFLFKFCLKDIKDDKKIYDTCMVCMEKRGVFKRGALKILCTGILFAKTLCSVQFQKKIEVLQKCLEIIWCSQKCLDRRQNLHETPSNPHFYSCHMHRK